MKLPRTRGINTNRRAYDNHIRVSFLSFTPRLHQYRDHGCNLQNHDQPTEYRSTTPPRYLAVDRLKNLEKTSIFSREEFFKSSRSVRIEKQPCTIGVNSYWFNRFPLSGALKSQFVTFYVTSSRRPAHTRDFTFYIEIEHRREDCFPASPS